MNEFDLCMAQIHLAEMNMASNNDEERGKRLRCFLPGSVPCELLVGSLYPLGSSLYRP